ATRSSCRRASAPAGSRPARRPPDMARGAPVPEKWEPVFRKEQAPKQKQAHVPEKWVPVFRKDHAPTQKRAHVPEKWAPVFRKEHAPKQKRAPVRETSLYAPVKRFLEGLGFAVKGEICGCDLVALRGDEPPRVVIGELKLGFSLELVLQGINRSAACDEVW